MVDAKGRPYFLWDEDITLEVFHSRLIDPDPEVRAYYLGKLMRQAKPDDVFTFVTLAEITALFPLVTRYLGRSRDFWTWLLDCWKALPNARLSPLQEQVLIALSGLQPAWPDRGRRTRRLPHQASRNP